MYNFTLGIIFSFIYSTLIISSTFCKDKNKMLKIQTFDQIFAGLSHACLTAYSATVVNVINIFRNYVTSKGKLTKLIATMCIILYIIFGISFNTRGLIGIFPIMASASYTIFCFKSKNAQIQRYGLIINLLLWIIHDIYVKAYPAVCVDMFVVLFTVFNIIKNSSKQ